MARSGQGPYPCRPVTRPPRSDEVFPLQTSATSVDQGFPWLPDFRNLIRRWPAATIAVPLVAVYLVTVPRVPDLAAQLTRAQIVRDAGISVWWPGWFGGMTMPTYSSITPPVMAVIGAPLVGALSALVAIVVASDLLRETARPRAASIAFGVQVLVNLLGGRITFLSGIAVGSVAIWLLARNRGLLAAPVGVLTTLASPIAGIFVGVVAGAVLLADSRIRVTAAMLAAATAGTGGVLWILFSEPGVTPMSSWHLTLTLAATAAVGLAVPHRVIRTGAALLVVMTIVAALVPNALGANIDRMVWLLGAPLVIALAPFARSVVVGLVALTATYPVMDAGYQMAYGHNRSAHPAYYDPLIDELKNQGRLHPETRGQRVEIVEPQTKGGTQFVAAEVPIARGWLRQVDRIYNEIFYDHNALTAARYQDWLNELAVGWVAVPDTDIDLGSESESRLVDSGLPYLRPIWSNADWTLYRVTGSQPLAPGLQVLDGDHGHITLRADRAGIHPIQIRWSKHLRVTTAGPGPDAACLAPRGDWSTLRVPGPGVYTVRSDLDLLPGGRPACVAPRT